jgi:hypothetical protein
MSKRTLKEELDLIKSRMNIMNETKNAPRIKYGCVMLFFDFPELKKIHDLIDQEDIYIDKEDDSFGLELEPHTTFLYGLHDGVSTEEVEKVLGEHTYESCKAHKASLFENEKYDVLKFDVEGPELAETNKELKEFPYTSDYPDYHPHLTIGYLKPGTGKKYADELKGEKYWLTPKYAVYSKIDGTKDKINVRID